MTCIFWFLHPFITYLYCLKSSATPLSPLNFNHLRSFPAIINHLKTKLDPREDAHLYAKTISSDSTRRQLKQEDLSYSSEAGDDSSYDDSDIEKLPQTSSSQGEEVSGDFESGGSESKGDDEPADWEYNHRDAIESTNTHYGDDLVTQYDGDDTQYGNDEGNYNNKDIDKYDSDERVAGYGYNKDVTQYGSDDVAPYQGDDISEYSGEDVHYKKRKRKKKRRLQENQGTSTETKWGDDYRPKHRRKRKRPRLDNLGQQDYEHNRQLQHWEELAKQDGSLPAFLLAASLDAVNRFLQIEHNPALTKRRIYEDKMQWANHQQPLVRDLYLRFVGQREHYYDVFMHDRKEVQKRMSPQARHLDRQIQKMWRERKQTRQQSIDHINLMLAKVPLEVQQELQITAPFLAPLSGNLPLNGQQNTIQNQNNWQNYNWR